MSREMDEEKVCGKCKWHRYSRIDGCFVCVSDQSEMSGEETEYKDHCEDWEER